MAVSVVFLAMMTVVSLLTKPCLSIPKSDDTIGGLDAEAAAITADDPAVANAEDSVALKIRASVLPALIDPPDHIDGREEGNSEEESIEGSDSSAKMSAVVLPAKIGSDEDDFLSDIPPSSKSNLESIRFDYYDYYYNEIVGQDVGLSDRELDQFMRALDYYEDLGVLTDENGDDLSEEEKVDRVLEIMASNDLDLSIDNADDILNTNDNDLQSQEEKEDVSSEESPAVVGDIDFASSEKEDDRKEQLEDDKKGEDDQSSLEYDYKILEEEVDIVEKYLDQDPDLADFLLHYDEIVVEGEDEDGDDPADQSNEDDSSEEDGSSASSEEDKTDGEWMEYKELFQQGGVFDAAYEEEASQDFNELTGNQIGVYFQSLNKDFRIVEIAFYIGSFIGVLLITFGILLCCIRLCGLGTTAAGRRRAEAEAAAEAGGQAQQTKVKNVKLSGIVKSYARLPVEIRNMKPSNVAYKELYNVV